MPLPVDMESWVEGKLAELTLEEKALMLSGVDVWRTYPVPRLGIPQLKTSDGPVGIRGGTMVDGTTAAMAPSAVSLAATWDTDIISQLGSLLATEMRDKKADILLAPTVCLHRSPLGGRNFESFSGDDPFLGGKLAAAYINAVQEHGIATTIKHFAANDQETGRFVVNQIMSERCLRELHLVPFQIAIRDANPWCIMASYSKINGVYASNNKKLLTDILRKEWGFDGMVMSDWFGVNSIVPSVDAGMDLEMPGPARKRGKNLSDAVKKGFMEEKTLDACVRRILQLIHKTGKYKYPDWVEEQEEAHDRPEHRQFLREAAADGIVLLKNEGDILPLTASKLDGIKQIAFIGPNADESVAAGGGSAALNPHYRQKPYQQFKANIASPHPDLVVKHARGCLANKFVPVFSEVCVSPKNGMHGMHMEYFGNMEHKGQVVHSAHRISTILSCYDNLPKSFTPGKRYSYRATGLLTPKTTGKHMFSMGTCGPGRMLLDGKEIINIWNRTKESERSEMFMAYASPEKRVEIDMVGGRTYTVEVEGVSRELDPIPVHYTDELYRDEVMDGSRVGFMEEVKENLFGDAVALAAESDIVVMVVGKNIEWESEAYDMKSMDLPGAQNELIQEVLKVNPNTIIVNQSGSPISMPWLAAAPTVVQAWYQGQELGNALFDVLVGAVNPSGKLPVTFPKRLEDTPCFHNFPGENDTVVYGEGIYLGYRHYEKAKIAPLFPFGHGLSYTTFRYSNVRVSSSLFSPDSPLVVSVDITNTGSLSGKESVQFYVSQTTKPGLPRPIKELKGFAKVSLQPGETKTACYTLDKYALGYFNDRKMLWVVDENAEFAVHAAASSVDVRGHAVFRVAKGLSWIV
ncbi:glycoside hydrolase superfamily [Tricharina praecox]|uniref:glycoside hydrolase superfamily n=1 Tax=Tricharina praecox TaxID=43433 RepID=UPI002220AAE9|nr:glycoside hydrolase superfamily [Tricharina praecox]KAI5858481.1 glycoside hydrolase superfamily [Tricharina praecox]